MGGEKTEAASLLRGDLAASVVTLASFCRPPTSPYLRYFRNQATVSGHACFAASAFAGCMNAPTQSADGSSCRAAGRARH